MKTYNKLIRDKIPEIMTSKGVAFAIRTLDETEFLTALKDKLAEEAQEVVGAQNRDEVVLELADVKECLLAIMQTNNIRDTEVEEIRLKRKEERGSFDKKIFLESTS